MTTEWQLWVLWETEWRLVGFYPSYSEAHGEYYSGGRWRRTEVTNYRIVKVKTGMPGD